MLARHNEQREADMVRITMARIAAATIAAGLVAGGASAQPPADIESKLREMGRVIDPVGVGKLYAPLFPQAIPASVTAAKDIAYGADPKEKLDVYSPAARGAAKPVLIFVPGGQGVKQLPGPQGRPFWGNVGVWGVENGLVTVVTQYRTGQGAEWDSGARDVAATIQWVKANIARYGGDPNRIVIMGQSNGATQLATYLGHADIEGPGGPGVRAAILESGNFDILPIRLTSPPARFIAAGPAPAGPPGAGARRRPAVDPAVMLRRSNLEGLKAQTIPIMLAAAELDPEERVEMVQVLSGELKKAGRSPTVVMIPAHSHISEMDSWGTADQTASAPILQFIRAHTR
jgi:triacylglycerol lipase